MKNSHTPDPLPRLVAHALVGCATALVSKRAFPQATLAVQVLGMLGSIAAHEELDAPVADFLARSTPL